jgi:TonB-dependent starch-binding outer membrane protein SusC
MSFQESTYDYVNGSLTANGENAVKKNNPLFYYLNFASASARREACR